MEMRWHLLRVKRLSITKIAEFFKIVLIPPINLSECLYIKDSFEIHPSLHPSHNPHITLPSSLPLANIVIIYSKDDY